MKRIAAGRASEIFDLGDGGVLRRFRAGGDPGREALVMGHVHANGYLVPPVLDVATDSVVLERIAGPTMLADLWRRPWRLRGHAQGLADLHERLHAIEAPHELAGAGSGDRVLHLDLHPENVILSRSGPGVVDWRNARGDPALDVAMTWVIGATSGGPPGRAFVRMFVAHFDRAEIVRALPAAAERRLADVNVTDRERARVRRLLDRAR